MHITQQQEQFSKAYLRAISAIAGCTLAEPEVDDDSIDITLSSKRFPRKPKLDIQLKCHMRDTCIDKSGLRYGLKRKNYDDLRATDVLVPRLLMVVVVPKAIENWLSQSDNEAMIRYCAYWASLRGLPDKDQGEITVFMPQANRVTSESLNELMQKIALGDEP
ncbi:DUF4365 domain-containing protein [Altericista sp. CCNU0014]|uniref:DUF4365 domain-containing protein n=1 Tax=Altericista sp. CCNU0014 TaxID=3082949 RepID=UPI00384E9CE8